MDAAGLESPFLEFHQKVVQGVAEFRENEQALLGMVKEALFVQQVPEIGQLCLDARLLDGLGLEGQLLKFRDFLVDLVGVAGKSDRLEQFFEALAVAFVHLLEVFRVGQYGRSELYKCLGAFQAFLEAPCAII